MAKQKNNIIMGSTRGMAGGQIVFKRRAGKGYVAAAPEVNENRQLTIKQLAIREEFKRSTVSRLVYGKLVIDQLGFGFLPRQNNFLLLNYYEQNPNSCVRTRVQITGDADWQRNTHNFHRSSKLVKPPEGCEKVLNVAQLSFGM